MADKSEFSNLKGFNKAEKASEKWTFKLFLCCLTASSAALQFGFCLSSLNTTTIPVQEFILKNFFLFENQNQNSPQNLTLSQTNENETEQLDLNRVSELKEIEIKKTLNLLWTFINCLFVLGQFIGGFASKFILEHLGRKNGFLFHNLVCFFASLLVILAPYVSSPVCVMISRFLFGVQAGLGISIVPVYLSEIPPDSLRGAAGTFFQLFVSIGISLAQVFGFKQIFGNSSYWHLQLAFPIVPGLLGSIVFLIFLPESPKALLVKGDYEAAKKSLQMIRNKLEVTEELERINQETLQNSSSVSFKDLLKSQRMRWPLITTITLFVGLQASGINAIFFYSASIFKDAGIESNNIQYAILLTGLINIPSNIACMPLIDKFGRRNLMLITTCLAIVNYIVLTVLLTFKDVSWILSYSSIVCILLFIILFSLAIGPIPGIYVCEVFQVHSRGTAIAIANMIACVSFLFVAFAFPILQASINQYVFLVFAALLTVVFLILYQKMPETKGKSVEEIVTLF